MRRFPWAIVGVVAVLLAGAAWWTAHRRATSPQRLEALRQQLLSTDPYERLTAAQALGAATPEDGNVILAEGQALLDLGRYSDAREILAQARGLEQTLRIRALELDVESRLRQAEELVANASVHSIDANLGRVDLLVNEAKGVIDILAADSRTEFNALVLEARGADLMARMLHVAQKNSESKLMRMRAADNREQIDSSNLAISQVRSRLDRIESRIETLCVKAREKREFAAEPLVLLLRQKLRHRQFDGVRMLAGRVAQLPELDAAHAAEVADTLMNLELDYAQHVLVQDVATARLLLSRAKTPVQYSPDFDLARANLALHDGMVEEALECTSRVLDEYPYHIRASCLRALAFVEKGETGEALALGVEVLERGNVPEAHYVLGRAYLAAGRTEQGLNSLATALQLRPDLLPARLSIISALAEADRFADATTDLAFANEQNPGHPMVRTFQARMYLEKTNGPALRKMLAGRQSGKSDQPAWTEAELAARMVLEDLPWVNRYLTRRREERQTDDLTLIAIAWFNTKAEWRPYAARIVAETLLEQFTDPLSSTEGPVFVPRGVYRPVFSSTQPASSDVSGVDPLRHTYFTPWPEEIALELVETALDHGADGPGMIETAAALNLVLGRSAAAQQWLEKTPTDKMGELGRALIAYMKGRPLGYNGLDGQTVLATQPAGKNAMGYMERWLALAHAMRRSGSEQARESLMALLWDHPWAEQAGLLVLRELERQDRLAEGEMWLKQIESVNSILAGLLRARWHLTMGQTRDAVQVVGDLGRRATMQGGLVERLAEVQALTLLQGGSSEIAGGVYAGLAYALPDRKIRMQVAWADVLLQAGDRSQAASILKSAVADQVLQSWEIDLVLSRCRVAATAKMMDQIIDGMQISQPQEPISLIYRAFMLAETGQHVEAGKIADDLLGQYPGRIRLLTLKAELAQRNGQFQTARSYLDRVVAGGGRAGQWAAKRLSEYAATQPVSREGNGP